MPRLLLFILALLAACGAPAAPSAPVALYDGQSFKGWTLLGGERAFIIEGGGVLAYGDAPGALVTAASYADFELTCQIRSDAGSSAGIALRCEADPRSNTRAALVVLADMLAPMAGKDACGSIRGVAPAKSAAMQPTGAWNGLKLTLRGQQLEVEVNDIITANARVETAASGHIALLGEGEFFWVREMVLRQL